MAFDDMVSSLIDALNENTAALKASMEVRTEALAVAKDAMTTEAAPEKPAAEKPAKTTKTTKTEKAKDEKPAEVATVEDVPAVEEADAYDGLKELIAGYMGVDRPEERAARKEKVLALLNHPKIKKSDLPADAKPDASNIALDSIPLFKRQIELLHEKGDLTEPAEEDSLI